MPHGNSDIVSNIHQQKREFKLVEDGWALSDIPFVSGN
ncbi:hypothetical protein CP488_01104 [Chthonomonas calidirosea]|nr:hypothetical protein CP488_01104 [Chthonomonas calidirosea]